MRILYFILFLLLFSSCTRTFQAERELNITRLEIKKKNLELDYLERLYRVKWQISSERKMEVIDSLITNFTIEH